MRSSIISVLAVVAAVLAGCANLFLKQDHVRRLYADAPESKEFWDVPGRGHVEAFGRQGELFRPRLLAFLDEALGRGALSASAGGRGARRGPGRLAPTGPPRP